MTLNIRGQILNALLQDAPNVRERSFDIRLCVSAAVLLIKLIDLGPDMIPGDERLLCNEAFRAQLSPKLLDLCVRRNAPCELPHVLGRTFEVFEAEQRKQRGIFLSFGTANELCYLILTKDYPSI